jgi:myotubularin-related protein 6/7/8
VQINAMANRAAGKGYENEANYENIKFHFSGIENIHTVRTSLQKLIESKTVCSFFHILVIYVFLFSACEQKAPTMSSFLSSLESSGWLKHIRSILDTSR